MNGRKISFDGWVLDRETGDLSRNGTRQRLQELPLKVLDQLLSNPGALVTREQLIAHLWPKGVVDFDTGLNTAVRKLRVALADVAEAPRYIETIPRRGYRFIGSLDAEAPVVPGPTAALEPVAAPNPVAVPLPESMPAVVPVSTPEISPADDKASAPDREPAGKASIAPPSSPRAVPRITPSRRLWLGIAAAAVLVLGAVYLWRQRATPVSDTAAPAAATSEQSLPDRSVAVLAFENLSTEPNNEFLALGIAEAVLHRLASVRELTVIARTSSFSFKNRNEDARQIGRALNARYLVEGSVQHVGESLRVQSQLIDADSGRQLWSLSFDRRLADIFALQDEISNKVAEQLSVSVAPEPKPVIEAKTSHLDAYLSYLQGGEFLSKDTIADSEKAVQAFATATQLDPQFAAAYAQQSRAIMRLNGWRKQDNPADSKRAEELLDRALALNPNLGEAWVERAGMIMDKRGPNAAAEAEKAFKKGLALAPNYGQGFEEYAEFLLNQNRIDEALSTLDRARQVDPLNPRPPYIKGMILDLVSGGDPLEVESLYLQALKLNPTYHPALVRLGWWYSLRGEYARALALQEGAVREEPESWRDRDEIAGTYLAIEDVAAAGDVLSAGQGPSSAMWICVLMMRGDHAAALNKAYEIYGEGRRPDTKTQASLCAVAEIMRDAQTTRQFGRALRVLESQYAIQSGHLASEGHRSFMWGLPYAQLLLATGQKERADRLLRAILASTDKEASEKRFRPLILAARAGALTALGEHDRALDALELAVHDGMHMFWWVMSRGSLYDALKQSARYKALDANTAQMMRQQRALVEKMRAAGDLPRRPGKVTAR